MSDYIEVDWEVPYEAGNCSIDKSELSGCKTKSEMFNMILDIMHEDALQYIGAKMLNTHEVDAFIDETMSERKLEGE